MLYIYEPIHHPFYLGAVRPIHIENEHFGPRLHPGYGPYGREVFVPYSLDREWLEEQQLLAAYRRRQQQLSAEEVWNPYDYEYPDCRHHDPLDVYHYSRPRILHRPSRFSSNREGCCARRGVTPPCGGSAQRLSNINDYNVRFRPSLRCAGSCDMHAKQDSTEPRCKPEYRRTCSAASDKKAAAFHVTLSALFEEMLKELSSANQSSADAQPKAGQSAPSTSDAPKPPTSTTAPADKKPEEQPFNLGPFFDTILKVFVPPEGTKPASTPAPASSEPKQSPPPSSLKEELEARLYSDPDVEIRDTVRALLASVFTHKSATNTSKVASDMPSDVNSAETKGKGKAKVSFTVPITDESPKDVASALDTVSNIEAAFFSLESDFTFPTTLDFKEHAASSPPATDEADTASIASLESRLSYSSRNAPVRYYMHALTALLSQLDAVESHGSDTVREKRKEVVDRVESALEDVERKVESRLANANPRPIVKEEETLTTVETQVVVDAKSDEALPVSLKSPVTEDPNKDVAPYILDDTDITTQDDRNSQPSHESHAPFEVRTQTNLGEDAMDETSSDLTRDALSSSGVTDTTVTLADFTDVANDTAVTTVLKSGDISDPEPDNLPPYLLRTSEEPESLSKSANRDRSGPETEVVVLKDDDVNSDWSEVEA